MSDSVIPSDKYSTSLLPLALANGITAMDSIRVALDDAICVEPVTKANRGKQ